MNVILFRSNGRMCVPQTIKGELIPDDDDSRKFALICVCVCVSRRQVHRVICTLYLYDDDDDDG